jgi:AcrR family transcriptional regulator
MIITHIFNSNLSIFEVLMPLPHPLRRRSARQARSKATVERILDSAATLTAERGGDTVTMTAIAKRAHVVIGSLYQYFSDKSAINRALLIRHHADVREMLKAYLKDIVTFDDLSSAIEAAAARYYTLHQTDSTFNGIWSAVQTDAELQAMDLKDTLENASYLYAVIRPILPHVGSDELLATCALLLQFALTTGRFGRALPLKLKRQVLPAYRRMLRNSLDALRAANARQAKIRAKARRLRAHAPSS